MTKCNERDLEWNEYDHGDSVFRRKELTNAVDAEKLGCSLYELEAGDRSWPYHYHTANEEALFVLEGEGRSDSTVGTGHSRLGASWFFGPTRAVPTRWSTTVRIRYDTS